MSDPIYTVDATKKFCLQDLSPAAQKEIRLLMDQPDRYLADDALLSFAPSVLLTLSEATRKAIYAAPERTVVS